jgi:hypothetical protein
MHSMKHLGVFVLFVAIALVGFGFAPQEKAEKKEAAVSTARTADVYVCPMHPEVKSDKPGECPKCKMQLEKKSTKGEMPTAKKGCSGCCCKGSSKAQGSESSSMKMDCQSDAGHAEHSKMSMKGCCAK